MTDRHVYQLIRVAAILMLVAMLVLAVCRGGHAECLPSLPAARAVHPVGHISWVDRGLPRRCYYAGWPEGHHRRHEARDRHDERRGRHPAEHAAAAPPDGLPAPAPASHSRSRALPHAPALAPPPPLPADEPATSFENRFAASGWSSGAAERQAGADNRTAIAALAAQVRAQAEVIDELRALILQLTGTKP